MLALLSGAMALVVGSLFVARVVTRNKTYNTRLREAVRSVNYHVTRQCNYACKFCFHTAKSSSVVTLDEAKRALRELADHGMQKINFAGGEPLLKAKFVGELCKFCSTELRIKVSIVTNGSKLTDEWLQAYGPYIDIIAVSCDSTDNETNREIGRYENKGREQIAIVREVAQLCRKHQIHFKMNTVVGQFNKDEDMNWLIDEVCPVRWKIFQVLPITGENTGEGALRSVEDSLISTAEFEAFVERHRHQPSLVKESNSVMRNSYLLVDEELRILDNGSGAKRPTRRIHEVGLVAAFRDGVAFDAAAFAARDGAYTNTILPDIEDLQ